MTNEKRYLYLSDAEWRVLLVALNKMRSKLIAQGRYTDAVDEIIYFSLLHAQVFAVLQRFKLFARSISSLFQGHLIPQHRPVLCFILPSFSTDTWRRRV